MHADELHARLFQADRPLGAGERTLVLGRSAICIEGLDRDLCRGLEARWGRFLERSAPGGPRAVIRVVDGGPGHWLDAPRNGEAYRLESVGENDRRTVASYHFGIGRETAARRWRLGITERASEPIERILENAVRFVTAHVTVQDGGFAMHAAGVLREGRAYLFAGPSRAGKSTVLRLLAPATSLGDDFGLVLPGEGGWITAALPFDNSERAPADPPEGLFPVAGIWRLHQADTTYVDRPAAGRAVASLMGGVAFPWAMPELSDRLLEQVERFIAGGCYRHLHFARDAALWSHLVS